MDLFYVIENSIPCRQRMNTYCSQLFQFSTIRPKSVKTLPFFWGETFGLNRCFPVDKKAVCQTVEAVRDESDGRRAERPRASQLDARRAAEIGTNCSRVLFVTVQFKSLHSSTKTYTTTITSLYTWWQCRERNVLNAKIGYVNIIPIKINRNNKKYLIE